MKADKKATEINLEDVFLRYWSQISFRVRRSIGFNNPEWEDICSNIILNVIESVKTGKFKGESSIGTYIFSITSHKITDYIRKKSRKPKYFLDVSSSLDPAVIAENKEQAEMTFKALQKIKSKHADIMYLYYYMGISQKQIGEMFSISAGRVSHLINSAKKSLKKTIEK